MTAEFNITIPGTEIIKRLADLERDNKSLAAYIQRVETDSASASRVERLAEELGRLNERVAEMPSPITASAPLSAAASTDPLPPDWPRREPGHFSRSTTMSTQLYYINHADILGDEQDLLVEATSVEEALYLWMEHYDIDPDDLGKSPEEDFYPSVFAVPALTGTPHPLQWHVEVKIVN